MDTFQRLRLLSSDAVFELGEDTHCRQNLKHTSDNFTVSNAKLPDGKYIRLLKTLQTSACERNCLYCPFRSGRDFKRTLLTPDEMAKVFVAIHGAGIVDGLFLSSGIIRGGVNTQDKILATAEILRINYDFKGYLHLKLMPGAEKGQIERALSLADRVSINLEAPNPDRLQILAPKKTFFSELLLPIQIANDIRRSGTLDNGIKRSWPSITTQFVVGAAGESDIELLSTTVDLILKYNLARAYYSAFNPITDTPLENLSPTNPLRQLRLYQASYLLRDYGFILEELTFNDTGNLPLTLDPKLAWANHHMLDQPGEINRLSKNELLRIPGIGNKGADAIIRARRDTTLRTPEQLSKLGVHVTRAIPYILLNGRTPVKQLSFW